MSRDLLLALIGVGGAILGAFAGGWSVVWTSAAAKRQKRGELRRQAYTAFIIATDKLHSLWPASAAIPAGQDVKLLALPTALAYEAIQEAYVAVLLTAPEEAEKAADLARKAARDIDRCLNPLGAPGTGSTPSADLIKAFTDARGKFIKLAPKKLD